MQVCYNIQQLDNHPLDRMKDAIQELFSMDTEKICQNPMQKYE